MRGALTILLSLVWVGGAALAQTPAPALSGHAAAGAAPEAAGVSAPDSGPDSAPVKAPVKAAKRERNGRARRVAVADRRQERPRGSSSVEEALSSCLALWEPSTHMTKVEWGRACRRVAERLRGIG
jgi:hypothetical protein